MFCKTKYIIYYFIFILVLKTQIIQTHKTQNRSRKLSGPPYIVTLTFDPNLLNKIIFYDFHVKMYSTNNVKVYVIKDDNSRMDVTSDLIFDFYKVRYNKTSCSKISLEFQTQLTTFREMFYLSNAISIFFEDSFNSLSVENMCSFFRKCESLKSIDVSNLNTLNTTDMSLMFDNCKVLSSLNLSNFVPKNLVTLFNMFNGCKALTSLDLSNFKISASTNVTGIFSSCRSLQYINFINFDILYLVPASIFPTLTFKYCQFYSYSVNIKECTNFIGFSKCGNCLNTNTDDYCENSINGKTIYLFYKKSQLSNSEKECYWFKDAEKCAYLKDSEISGIETDLSNISCEQCNNLFGYYPLEKDINNDKKDCYKQEEIANSFIYDNGNIKYLKICDISCNNCTEESRKCYECNSNYYRLKEKQEQYSYCYNEDTKPKNYFLNETSDVKYYESCDVSCNNCTEESKNCIICSSNYYKLKEKKDQNSQCYDESDKPVSYFLKENGNEKYFEACDNSCYSCTQESEKCIQCSQNYYKLIENKDQNSNCYNEKTKPTNYYLIENDGNKYYQSCDNSCLTCIDESTKCIECNSNFYKLKENKNQNSICYNDATKPSNYFLNEVNKYFEVCDNSCNQCKDESKKCDQCTQNYYRLEDHQEQYNYCYNEATKPLNYYFDQNLNIFKKCHSDCESCNEESNSESTNCISCIDKTKISYLGNCINNKENSCKNEKCKLCNEDSTALNLCLQCNIDKGYYPISEDNNQYIDCYSKKPEKYYLDLYSKSFKKCFETCKLCDFGGNENENNCTECENNYMFIKDYLGYEKNCFLKCEFFYYFVTDFNNCFYKYLCTKNAQCPEGTSLLYAEQKQCLKQCSDHTYAIYQYSGECLKNCPEGTKENENNVCIQKADKCEAWETNFDIPLKNLKSENILILLENYANEFNYTEKHISIYKNIEYTLTLYQDFDCYDELDLNISRVDLTDCFSKAEQYYNISKNNFVAITINIVGDNSTKLIYFVYDTINFYQLPISSVCTEKINKIKNIFEIQNLDTTISDFLLRQNINIFDNKEPFYNDICFHFESINGKDIAIKDRMKIFYPNIIMCEDECENIGVNLTSMTAICECKTKDFKTDLMESIAGNEISEIFEDTNLAILKCYKDLFDLNLWLKNQGALIILSIIFIQIICTLLFVFKEIDDVKIFISSLIRDFKQNKNLQKKNNKNPQTPKSSKSNSNLLISTLKNPPKKRNNIANIIIYNDVGSKDKKSKDDTSTLRVFQKKISRINKKGNTNRRYYVKYRSSKHIRKNNNINSLFDKIKNDNKKKEKNKDMRKEKDSSKIKSKNKQKNLLKNTRNIRKSKTAIVKKTKIDDIIDEPIDEMDYITALAKDKRPLCTMFLAKIEDKVQIVNIFIYNDIVPRGPRILLLILNIDIYFLINGLFYNEEYISKLYHSKEKETVFSFIKRSAERIVYTSLVGVAVEFLIDCFFPEEASLRSILENTKNNIAAMTVDLERFYKKTRNDYIIFISISYIITLFSLYYVICFNNVYPNTKFEWIKSSVVICIIMQLYDIIKCCLYSTLRLSGLNWKIERFFKLSQNFN